MGVQIFLTLSGLGWLLYGIYCFLVPGSLAEAAGVVAQSPTATTELRAMYGGLQAAIGVLALFGAARGDLRRTALLTIGFITAGLGTTRLLGVILDGGISAYTVMGLIFEFGSAGLVVWLRGPVQA